jgi:small subunit ribosomal protein S1
MVNRNLIREFDVTEDESLLYNDVLNFEDEEYEGWLASEEAPDFDHQEIVTGRVIRIDKDMAIIDIGYKSEGVIPTNEWEEKDEPPFVGQEIQVLIEEVEDTTGMVRLSKKKAERVIQWDRVIKHKHEGDVVCGPVTKKIKGGLLVDIGVPVFLPASQVDIRRPADIGDYIGRYILCLVLKIDDTRRNIVVSRRGLIEQEREKRKKKLLEVLQPGQVRRGVVKNIADFGAFVDLGGIDGLLHITDMDYVKVGHPSERVTIDQEIEVMILNVDREREKIALGTKQLKPSPWQKIDAKYPVGAKVRGKVVNVMTYGAFVKLEDGIEGLVHISEMSWVKRIQHPTEVVNIGDEVEVMVLGINKEKEEISLGMKQCMPNPWDELARKYPPGTLVEGTVRNLTNYGAFIEIEEGIDGLLHVSDMSWVKKVGHPSEMVEKGQEVKCVVLNIDTERRRIALGLKQLEDDPWATAIPDKYQQGMTVTGKVTKLTNFGVFVGLEDGLEGLLHISELAEHKVENPEEVVNVGDEIEVKILRVDIEDRKIGLSRKRVDWTGEQEEAAEAEEEAARQQSAPLKGGLGGDSGPLIG